MSVTEQVKWSIEELQPEMPNIRKRLATLGRHLSSYFVGRNAEIELMITCAVAQEPMLLVGPPGTGKTLMGNDAKPVELAKICQALGVERIKVIDPYSLEETRETLKKLESRTRVRSFYIDDSKFDRSAYYPLTEIVTIVLWQYLNTGTFNEINGMLEKINIASVKKKDGIWVFRLLPNAKKYDNQELIKRYALLKRLLRAA